MKQNKNIQYPNRIIIDEFDLLLNDRNLRKAMEKVITMIVSKQKVDFTFCGASLPKRVENQNAIEFIENRYKIKLDVYKSEQFNQLPQKL